MVFQDETSVQWTRVLKNEASQELNIESAIFSVSSLLGFPAAYLQNPTDQTTSASELWKTYYCTQQTWALIDIGLILSDKLFSGLLKNMKFDWYPNK